MRSLTSRALGMALVGVLVGTTSADAQITRFYGEDNDGSESTRATNVNSLAARNQFFSFLIGVGTETFEAQAGGAPLALAFAGGFTATLNGTGSVASQGAGTNGNGRYPISGQNYWSAVLSQSATFSVTFNQQVAAFGFYAIDLGDFGSNLTLQFLRGGSLIDTWMPYTTTETTCASPTNPYCGSIKYIATINTNLFDEVRFLGSSSDDVFAFDDMSVGSLEQIRPDPNPNVVPEPGTYALLAMGLAGLGIIARRRRLPQ